jgi:hypothetical protein
MEKPVELKRLLNGPVGVRGLVVVLGVGVLLVYVLLSIGVTGRIGREDTKVKVVIVFIWFSQI